MISAAMLVAGALAAGPTEAAKTASVPPLPQPTPGADARRATPPAAPDSKATPQPETPPDTWSASEIADAQRVCADVKAAVRARFEVLPPRREGNCGAPAPIRLEAIDGASPVRFSPAPVVTCDMLRGLARWIDEGLQPLAERLLDSSVREIKVVSSYACRTRYGRAGARMSEHAFANALDIAGFGLADGREVRVLDNWGQTRRDLVAAAAAAKEAQKAQPLPPIAAAAGSRGAAGAGGPGKTAGAPARTAGLTPPAGRRQSQTPGSTATLPPLPQRRPLRGAFGTWRTVAKPGADTRKTRNAPQPRLKPKPKRKPQAKPRHAAPLPAAMSGPGREKARFLRESHRIACGVFGTTLGPEANEAHRDHFHVDMFPRRNRGYCE